MASSPAVEEGMRRQLEAWRTHLRAGHRRVGWKIGINDSGAQKALGIDSPVVGYLTSLTQLKSGATLRCTEDSQFLIEAEVAIEVARDVPPSVSGGHEIAAMAVGGLAPAIEVVDFSRAKDGIGSILSHDIFHAGFVLGATVAPSLRFEPSRLEPKVIRNGEVVRTADPALVPSSYPEIVALVAHRLAEVDERLRAGDRVISGSFTQGVAVSAGDGVRVDFGLLGSVELSFA